MKRNVLIHDSLKDAGWKFRPSKRHVDVYNDHNSTKERKIECYLFDLENTNPRIIGLVEKSKRRHLAQYIRSGYSVNDASKRWEAKLDEDKNKNTNNNGGHVHTDRNT